MDSASCFQAGKMGGVRRTGDTNGSGRIGRRDRLGGIVRVGRIVRLDRVVGLGRVFCADRAAGVGLTGRPGATGRSGLAAALLVFAALLIGGCAGVAVRPVPMGERLEALNRTALNSSRPSERTLAYMLQRDLQEQWESRPQELLHSLAERFRRGRNPDAVFAVMELAHLEALRPGKSPEEAASWRLASLLAAYAYLFDPKAAPPVNTVRPDARAAQEFYNRNLAEYLRFIREKGFVYQKGMLLPLPKGAVRVSERADEFTWKQERFASMRLCFDYQTTGLSPQMVTQGIGVPLALGLAEDKEKSARAPFRQTYAATFFLRIDTDPRTPDGQDPVYEASMEIHDPMRSTSLEVGQAVVPLETDITTPLAFMAVEAPEPQGIKGMTDPAALEGNAGLYMLQPYQKDKIPVVFVHGLMSSPHTWLPMLNGLMGDPELRKRYQFWFFQYPTGNPVLYSASLLRGALAKVRQAYDPQGTNASFERMVLVSHSMGGLLSKTMVLDGGDALYETWSKTPLENLDLDSQTRALMERVFLFRRQKFVSRVVFISVPHRGSDMALGIVGRIGNMLISLPTAIAKAGAGVVAAALTKGGNANTFLPRDRAPTGIDSLSPTNPVLTILADMAIPVPYHSIVGNEKAAATPGGSDGVVPYRSSHLEGASSELIVKSGHGAHTHPLAIREVRRILFEHLEQAAGR